MAVDQNNEQVDPTLPESYEHLLEDYSHFAPPAADEVLQGTVLGITAKDVIIDFGYKSEGIVPIEQFQSPSGEVTVQARRRGRRDDRSRQRAARRLRAALAHAGRAAAHLGQPGEGLPGAAGDLSGRVLGRVKGGLAVDVGIKAFMPGSQADPRPVHNLDSLVGQDIPVKIIKLNRRRGNVVVSRKMAVEEEINVAQDASRWSICSKARWSPASVKNLTDYGAFIDLGGIDGLLHVTDMSYGRVTHPSEMLQVGEEITVKVLKFDRAKERVSLGIKQLEPDPWETVVGALSGERPRDRARGERHRLRRVRGAGAGRGRPDPHQRDDVVAAHEASLEGGEAGRSGGGRGSGSASQGPPDFARAEAAGTESVDHHRQPLQRGLAWWKAGCAT